MHGSIKLAFRLKVIPLNSQKTIMLTEKIEIRPFGDVHFLVHILFLYVENFFIPVL